LLLLSNPNPLSLGFGFAFWGNEVEPDAFSSYGIVFRTGELTGEACLNKNRRPPIERARRRIEKICGVFST